MKIKTKTDETYHTRERVKQEDEGRRDRFRRACESWPSTLTPLAVAARHAARPGLYFWGVGHGSDVLLELYPALVRSRLDHAVRFRRPGTVQRMTRMIEGLQKLPRRAKAIYIFLTDRLLGSLWVFLNELIYQ